MYPEPLHLASAQQVAPSPPCQPMKGSVLAMAECLLTADTALPMSLLLRSQASVSSSLSSSPPSPLLCTPSWATITEPQAADPALGASPWV